MFQTTHQYTYIYRSDIDQRYIKYIHIPGIYLQIQISLHDFSLGKRDDEVVAAQLWANSRPLYIYLSPIYPSHIPITHTFIYIYISYIYISIYPSLSLYIVYTYFYINRKGILSCDEKPVTDLLASALSTEECKFTELVGGKTLIRLIRSKPSMDAFREGNEVGQNSLRSQI